ncbi:MAG: heavy metal-binding domain-containing protein [Elusimicrobiota bacterium]
MKKVCLVAGMLLVGGLSVKGWAGEPEAPVETKQLIAEEGNSKTEVVESKKVEGKNNVKECLSTTVFVCAAHPDRQSEKKGKCPKCGMKLKKKQILSTYACPDKNCDYQSGKPGKCPDDNQDLIKTEVKQHCPKCSQPVNPEDLLLKPVK